MEGHHLVAVGRHSLPVAIGPANFKGDRSAVRAQAEVQVRIILISLSGATLHLAHQSFPVEFDPHLGSEGGNGL